MSKNSRYIIPFALMLVLFVLADLTGPKKTDWTLSFSQKDKKPYGSYILYSLLPGMFEDSDIFTAPYPIYNMLEDNEDTNSVYIIINDVFNPDRLDTEQLLDFVRKGNNVFASANEFGRVFSDSLKLNLSLSRTGGYTTTNLVNKNLRKGFPYRYKNPASAYYFSSVDSSITSVIGEDASKRPDFIRIKLGAGSIYLNSIPVAFTNYNILDSLNAGYVFKALSYLPADTYTVYWDEYYKTGKADYSSGPLQFITSNEALRWAYYILLFSIIFYIIFAGRRRQRIIPVIQPPANTTLEFVNTVGRLYYQQKDHKNIAEKKITYFLDQVRNRYFIKTDEITDDTLKKAAGKSGLPFQDVKEIFSYFHFVNQKEKVSVNELHKLNSLIESFYKKAGFHG